MKYVRTIEEFLDCFYNNHMCFNVNNIQFIDEFRLDYLMWEELRKYCLKNALENPNLYAILGEMYLFGKGVKEDKNKALEYLNLGIFLKSLYCMKSKANQLIDGDYLEANYDEAFKLFTDASKQEFNHAINNLGFMYCKGLGCKENKEYGISLYKKAADLGSTIACFNYGVSIINLDYNKAIEYLTKSANKGYGKAQNFMGELYFQPEYLHLDYEKAFYWFEMGALNFNQIAMKNLGIMYRDGLYVNQDYKKAEFYFKLAIDNGYDYATVYLAQLYNEINKNIW